MRNGDSFSELSPLCSPQSSFGQLPFLEIDACRAQPHLSGHGLCKCFGNFLANARFYIDIVVVPIVLNGGDTKVGESWAHCLLTSITSTTIVGLIIGDLKPIDLGVILISVRDT